MMPDTLEELQKKVRKIEDFQDITNLQAQYSYLVDTQQIEQLVDLFADEFVWEVGVKNMVRIDSKPDLSKYLKSAGAGNALMRHPVSTPFIEIEGDRAKGTWYMFGAGTSITKDGEVANWTQGRYDNEYVRQGDVWKICLLSFRFDFRTPYQDGWVKTPMMREEWSRR